MSFISCSCLAALGEPAVGLWMAGWAWTSVFRILQGNKSSDFHSEVWHWLRVFLQLPFVRWRNSPSSPSLLSVVVMKRSWVCQMLLLCVLKGSCFFLLYWFDISLCWSSDLNDLCSCDKSHPVLMYHSCTLPDSVCWGLFRVSVQFSRSVVSESLRPHGLQHTRPPCPSLTPGACSNSCPSSGWCHPAISSSVVQGLHICHSHAPLCCSFLVL